MGQPLSHLAGTGFLDLFDHFHHLFYYAWVYIGMLEDPEHCRFVTLSCSIQGRTHASRVSLDGPEDARKFCLRELGEGGKLRAGQLIQIRKHLCTARGGAEGRCGYGCALISLEKSVDRRSERLRRMRVDI